MSALEEALEQFKATLLRAGDRSVHAWAPGPTEAAVKAVLAHADIRPHEELVTWFVWHGETSVESCQWIGGTQARWIPLEFAVEQYQQLRAMDAALAGDLGGNNRYWPSGLFPVCERAGGLIGVRQSPEGGESALATFYADSGAVFVPAFRRLVDLVAAWIQLHEGGGYTWDGASWVEHPERISEVLPSSLR